MENNGVAYCGLYCGECKSRKKGKCPGCYGNTKASWCEIRKCCKENGYDTCADCTIMSLKDCKKYNNVFARIIGFVTKSDRGKCIYRIREIGIEAFAVEMSESAAMSMKK